MSADVHNAATQPVFAAVFERRGDGSTRMLATERVDPDGQVTVGPVSPSNGARAFLVVDTKANPRALRMINLSPGGNRFEVTQVGESGSGMISVQRSE